MDKQQTRAQRGGVEEGGVQVGGRSVQEKKFKKEGDSEEKKDQ
jgi:hypothetical protein